LGDAGSPLAASKANNTKEIKPFSLMGLDGVRHSLSDWKGKVVMLNFWATWCSPCLSEIRDFVGYQEQYKARGLQIVGLGLDEEKKLRNVQRTLEINYPVLLADPEANRGLMNQWGNSSGVVPYTVVIDRDGRVAYSHRGQMERDVFDEFVLPLLDNVL
jgi:peroxiredoxin